MNDMNVSIHARPQGRAQPLPFDRQGHFARRVSIHARPQGRAQLVRSPAASAQDDGNVSIHARPQGRAQQHG